jgi:hypothetical protein
MGLVISKFKVPMPSTPHSTTRMVSACMVEFVDVADGSYWKRILLICKGWGF